MTRGFSPEINVCTDPRFGRTQENFGGDALHVAVCGVAIATGLGGAGSANSPSEYVADGSLSCEAKYLARLENVADVYMISRFNSCTLLKHSISIPL